MYLVRRCEFNEASKISGAWLEDMSRELTISILDMEQLEIIIIVEITVVSWSASVVKANQPTTDNLTFVALHQFFV